MLDYPEPPAGMKPVINKPEWPGYLRRGNWTNEGWSHTVMQSDEDQTHGTHVRSVAQRALDERLPGVAKAIQDERDAAEAEPYAIDESAMKDADLRTRAYMAVWDHYGSAFNAVIHRDLRDSHISQVMDLIEATTGHRPVSLPEAEDWEGIVWRASQERSRLLSRVESLVDWAECLRDLCHHVGINPNGKTPLEIGRAIRASIDMERKQ